MKKKGQKMFVVRKYIMASSAKDALRKEKKTEPDDVYIDTDWQKGQSNQLANAIGFEADSDRDYD